MEAAQWCVAAMTGLGERGAYIDLIILGMQRLYAVNGAADTIGVPFYTIN